MMTEDCIPIVEVSDENFDQLWPALNNAIKEASFVALDCELSGLGNRSKLNCSEIDLRYQNIKDIAQEYAIVSLGISCFMCQSSSSVDVDGESPNQSVKTHNYIVQTFNVLTLCSTRYMVEYNSVRFLLSHGFDFNRQYSHGLPYTRGEDKEARKRSGPAVKDLFNLVIRHRKPIVLHNGLVDLIFLYQSFYADLPRNVETFAADVLEMFPTGVYDTKYISEFHQNFSATFLEYIFKKLQLENDVRMKNGAWHCRVRFPPYPREGVKGLSWHKYLQVFERNQEQPEGNRQPLCDSYKYHGWCPKASSCTLSHSVDRIVWELPPPKKRKRRLCASISYSSVAQLISLKKRKMEKERNNCTEDTTWVAPDTLGTPREDSIKSRGLPVDSANGRRAQSSPSHDRVAKGSSDTKGDIKDSSSRLSEGVDAEDEGDDVSEEVDAEDKDDDVAIRCYENGHSGGNRGRTDDTNIVCSEKLSTSVKSRNSVTHSSGNYSSPDNSRLPLLTIQDGERAAGSLKQRDCNGHSAGFDAFMTGFIFACDVAMLGQLPTVHAFQNPEEMNMHHMAGKVYLIGKEFPFLVRSSAYGGTSPTHDRIIKNLRGPQAGKLKR